MTGRCLGCSQLAAGSGWVEDGGLHCVDPVGFAVLQGLEIVGPIRGGGVEGTPGIGLVGGLVGVDDRVEVGDGIERLAYRRGTSHDGVGEIVPARTLQRDLESGDEDVEAGPWVGAEAMPWSG